MKIYISGKITGLSKKEYTANFYNSYIELLERKLINCSKQKVNPLNIKPLFGIKKWFFFMWSDIRELRKCDAIAMQTNWTESKGAVIEYFIAKFIMKIRVIKLEKV